MNGLISAIKSFVLKNRPAYKDYLGNGKYDVKKLPEECVPDSVNTNIRTAKNKADSAYDKADSAYDEASSAYSRANLAYDKASDVNSRLFTLTNLNYNFKTLEYTAAKEANIRTEVADTNGISAIPLAESTAPMKCHFDIVLKDSNDNRIGGYTVFDKKIVRGITKISETYKLFIDERVELGPDGYAELKIGYQLNSNDNLWRKFIGVVISLPSADVNNSNISKVFINAYTGLVDVDNYAPWPSICVPLAGTNDAGVVYASDKTDDQTVPVSIDKNGYLWCKGSEALPTDGNPGDILVKTETGSAWQKQEPATSTPDWNQNDSTASDYIKNRPFYTGEQIFTEIIPEQTYTLSSIGRGFTAYEDSSGTYPYSLEEGKNYTVVYNGTTYELTSASFQNMAYVGDVGPFSTGSEPSVPFAILAGSGMLQIVDYIGSTEVTFKISANAQEIKQIDTKYIPWKDAIILKQPTIIRNNPEDFTDDQKKMYYDLFCSGSLLIYVAEESKRGVVLDVFYRETVGFKMVTIQSAGYLNLYSNGKWERVDISDHGIRNIVDDVLSDITYWKLYNNSGTVPVGGLINSFIEWNDNTGKACITKHIRGSGLTTYETNDIVCYGDKEIVLSSSTPNSTKKFKITVDDTGTLSATEVT